MMRGYSTGCSIYNEMLVGKERNVALVYALSLKDREKIIETKMKLGLCRVWGAEEKK